VEDVDRLTISVGKFAANDFFDDNTYSHDPRTRFMNWALWESAAWDYPADGTGFTGGAVVEWNTKDSTWHYGIFLEPATNGAGLDYHVGQANGQILQYDHRYHRNGRSGTIRTFVYWNQARMGSYADASTQPYPEDIALTRAYRSKVGFGLSWDQELTSDLGAFARLSWNDGRTESIAFTEIDRSAAGGLSLAGASWGRPTDTAGLAIAVDGISSEHQHYLEGGGTGLILGDGGLSYSPEEIVETYYAFQPLPWLQISPDFQYIRNPGYNSVRGPVPIYAIRAHLKF
jgi:high affinity Mn2+ porin